MAAHAARPKVPRERWGPPRQLLPSPLLLVLESQRLLFENAEIEERSDAEVGEDRRPCAWRLEYVARPLHVGEEKVLMKSTYLRSVWERYSPEERDPGSLTRRAGESGQYGLGGTRCRCKRAGLTRVWRLAGGVGGCNRAGCRQPQVAGETGFGNSRKKNPKGI